MVTLLSYSCQDLSVAVPSVPAVGTCRDPGGDKFTLLWFPAVTIAVEFICSGNFTTRCVQLLWVLGLKVVQCF